MNKTCRVIWSHVHHQFVAVSEVVSAHGKARSTTSPGGAALNLRPGALAWALAMALGGGGALAQTLAPNTLPTGGQVVAGQASIGSTGAQMVVQQASQRAAINWQSFNIGSAASVHFAQPNAQAITLNRVTGDQASQILGRMTAPGQVILSNGNGIYFGKGSNFHESVRRPG